MNNEWIGGVRSSHIPGYRIIKRFPAVEWRLSVPNFFDTPEDLEHYLSNNGFCLNPPELKDKLRQLSLAQGANGFVELWWENEGSTVSISNDRIEVSHEEYETNNGDYFRRQGDSYFRKTWEGNGFIEELLCMGEAKWEPISKDYYDKNAKYERNDEGRYFRRVKNSSKVIKWINGRAIPVILEATKPQASASLTENTLQNFGNIVPSPIVETSRSAIPPQLIIDGTNIIRAQHGESVNGLLACIRAFDNTPCHVFVLLDANTLHVLEEVGDFRGKECLTKLLKNSPDRIVMVPAGSQADDFILLRADKDNCHIISNDRYLQYLERYPWLSHGRLHKFLFMNGHLMIPDFGIDVVVQS